MKLKNANHAAVLIVVLFTLTTVVSCKKSKDSTPAPPQNTELSDADSLKYLMYNIMQVSFVNDGRDTVDFLPTYYWYKSVPKLNPLSSAYDSADVLLAQMKTYAINPTTNKPYDKYSFLDHGEVAGEIQQGVSGDMGMQVTYASDAAGKTYLLNLLDMPETKHYKYALLITLQKGHVGTIIAVCFANEKGAEFFKNINKASKCLKFKS